MLKVCNVSKKVGVTSILEDVSYDFYEGNIYVLKGISGCGKTTLLNIIAGLDQNYSGDLIYNDEAIDNKKLSSYRKKIGYVFQNSILISNVLVIDNLRLIKNDIEMIEYWAKRLNVYEELYKYPEQLSGGQRQRISVIRALLLDCKILVADEPTAALDKKNSKILADVFKELISEDIIIIICTHEDCFDEIADVIIKMTYRKIDTIVELNQVKTFDLMEEYNLVAQNKEVNKQKISQRLYDIAFVNKRNKKKRTAKKMISSIIVFTLLIFCIVCNMHFSDIFRKLVFSDYKYNVFSVDEDAYVKMKEEINLKEYNNYIYNINDNTIALGLLDKEDSSLDVRGVIAEGEFPTEDNQILVNEYYVYNELGEEDLDKAIGARCEIASEIFYICGVVVEEGKEDFVYSNSYYVTECENVIYMNYDKIASIGTLRNTSNRMVVVDNLYDKNTYKLVNELLDDSISIWDDKIKESSQVMNMIVYIVLLTVILIALVAIAFIYNSINLELFYRSKEIGYLQVFNVDKKRILRMLVLEKSVEWARIIMYSCIIIAIGLVYLSMFININILNDIIIVAISILCCMVYCVFVTFIPTRKFLKKDAIALIKL